jgi:hypothetical protein
VSGAAAEDRAAGRRVPDLRIAHPRRVAGRFTRLHVFDHTFEQRITARPVDK